MAAINNKNTNQQVYNVREDEQLLSQIAHVTCLLMQRGLWIAGYNDNKELLTIHFNSHSNNKPVWEIDFFEHLFGNEPLLAAKDKVKAVFICSGRDMVVPNELYNNAEATAWLKKVHFVENTDEVIVTPLQNEKAQHLMAVPNTIPALIKINFRNAAILPFPMHHFSNSGGGDLKVHCAILPAQAYVTVHNNNQLLWYQLFDYTVSDDIAYNIKHFLRENNIESEGIAIICDATTRAEFEILRDLQRYFYCTTADSGKISARWDASISLANQLLSCAL
jgi:hypothetical protein